MCGIAGYFLKTDRPVGIDLTKASEVLRHRGPDASGKFCDHIVGLAHQRLSILDVSENGAQPMASACGRYIMAYNGECYNYKALADKYLPGFKWRSGTDTEVVLELFVVLGHALWNQMNGMFALAMYDQHTNTLVLVRDKLGKKPLYVYENDHVLCFGSEMKAIRAMVPYSLDINRQSIIDFLHLNTIPAPATIFKNVHKMVPGTFMTIIQNKIEHCTYHTISAYIQPILEDVKINRAISNVDILLKSAVEARMRSDVPFGAFLSGGLDSGIITAMASKVSPTRLQTFTIGFDHQNHDERPYADTIAKHLNTEHHTYLFSKDTALAAIDQMTVIFDEPFGDTSALPMMCVSQMASKSVKMVLSGDGGDELFMGYGAYPWAERLGKWYMPYLKSLFLKTLSHGNSRYKRISKMFDYGSNTNIQSHIFSQEQYFFSARDLNRMLSANYRSFLASSIFDLPSFERRLLPVELQNIWDIKYYLGDDLLTKVDRTSMLYSLEVRSPMLDDQLMQYVLNLPQQFKLRGGVGKYILREVAKKYYPESFFERPKKGFSIPLQHWLKNELYYLIEKFANKPMTEHYGIFEWREVKNLVHRYMHGEDYLYQRLWLIICLHKWLIEVDSSSSQYPFVSK